MILYRNTSSAAAAEILRDGFRSASEGYMVGHQSAVWLSDRPLDESDGSFGEVVLTVIMMLTEAKLAEYEVTDAERGYREWLVPAPIVNAHAKCSILKLRTRIAG